MNKDSVVLCASSAYNKKYYFNEDFDALPEQIKNELQIISVLFTEDVGGILSLEFQEDGSLILRTHVEEGDLLYDDIGSVLKIKEVKQKKKDLLESLEMFYRTFFLDEDISDLL